jgi:hypothetical protein
LRVADLRFAQQRSGNDKKREDTHRSSSLLSVSHIIKLLRPVGCDFYQWFAVCQFLQSPGPQFAGSPYALLPGPRSAALLIDSRFCERFPSFPFRDRNAFALVITAQGAFAQIFRRHQSRIVTGGLQLVA